MRIAIDSDANGRDLKAALVEYLKADYEVVDLNYAEGAAYDYPDVAFNLAAQVRDGQFDRGILICGTGLGMAICANKVEGIRAGACSDVYAAERLMKSNNGQVLCLGAQITGVETAKMLASAYLKSEFARGRSLPKVERIEELERKQHS
jgi:ribose 5-phosphate isomerase B